MNGINEIFCEFNRQTLLLSGEIKSQDAADELDKLQKQIHKTRQVFERDYIFQEKKQ